jgi:hypothetical protein
MEVPFEEHFEDVVGQATGGHFRPNTWDPAWRKLIAALKDNKYTPEEFCYFITHHFKEEGATNNHILLRKHVVSGDSTWEAFTKFKKARPEEIKVLVKLQRETLRTHVDVFGDLFDILLNNMNITVNPVVRTDYALLEVQKGNEEFKQVVAKYLDDALYIVAGSPEYLKECRFLAGYIQETKG